MDRVDGTVIVSATDLVGHLACGHLSVLSHAALDGVRLAKQVDPSIEVLQRRGLEHEAAYLATLVDEGLDVVEIAQPTDQPDRLAALRRREAETAAAMASGVDIVFQATFLDETEPVAWRGHADFLRRVERRSDLGPFSYEPEDTKLARQVKPSAVLQLCQYAHEVERLQGVAPQEVHVVLGGQVRESVRLDEVASFYRTARARFLHDLARERLTYPLPVAHCAVCRWLEVCEERREADDHLSRVANLTGEQTRKLESAGISTLAGLGSSPDTLAVKGLAPSTLARLRQQARLQRARGDALVPLVELVRPVEPEHGLAALPEPDAGDLFYDIEGDPHVAIGGLEYLHGLASVEGGTFVFEARWAHTPEEERLAFEQVIDRIVERRRSHPAMHVYHYAPYEPSALGKLMGRYGTRETELDELLTAEVFVDLYRVVRQGLVIGSPSYSLKKLEPLYMKARPGAIVDAGSSIVEYERWLQEGDDSILKSIEAYNRDDVVSTWRLRDWLEERRTELSELGEMVARPVPKQERDAAPEGDADGKDDDDLVTRLLAGRSEPPGQDDDELTHARWLMAHLLRWHQREDRPEWWRFFDRVLRCDDADLLADTEAIAGLRQVGEPTPVKRSLVWRYEFDPEQEHKLREGVEVADPAAEARKLRGGTAPGVGTLVAVDAVAGTLLLRREATSKAAHPTALIPSGPVRAPEQRASLRRVAEALLVHGIDDVGPARAARQLLARRPPQVTGVGEDEPLRRPDETVVAAATRLTLGLEDSHLPVQGPPGSGKTRTAAKVIVELVTAKRTVGITANSHAVITNLLRRVVEEAAEQGVVLSALQKAGPDDDAVDHASVTVTNKNGDIEGALATGSVDVVAGTGWLFAREAMAGSIHTLVVDEAGQLSLANAVAVAPAASNLVLIGDPRQLAQPSRGSHPEGAAVSALEHVLAGAPTVPDHLGLFLDRTWRLHPKICSFVSEQVYDDRLESEPHCERQVVDDGPIVGGAGLRWLGIEHEGNRTSSTEEADAVVRLFHPLVGRPWVDADGVRSLLGVDDVLVVAPYNAQVRLLAERLPVGARVGTVDRFQGREAPVVLVSMAASSAEDVPRGMEFLYSRNRLNVAVSRAQALCVMVGSPTLLAVRCHSVDQMRLANVLCRYVEVAEAVPALTDP